MDIFLLTIAVIFFGICVGYVGFLDQEGKLWKT